MWWCAAGTDCTDCGSCWRTGVPTPAASTPAGCDPTLPDCADGGFHPPRQMGIIIGAAVAAAGLILVAAAAFFYMRKRQKKAAAVDLTAATAATPVAFLDIRKISKISKIR